jgi:DNA-binding transcriptional ArsR family regulator
MPLPTSSNEVERIAASFKGLAHPTRLRILEALRARDSMSPTQIRREAEPKVALGTVSHHMRELVTLGLVAPAGTRAARGAVEHFYKLSPRGRRLVELIDEL